MQVRYGLSISACVVKPLRCWAVIKNNFASQNITNRSTTLHLCTQRNSHCSETNRFDLRNISWFSDVASKFDHKYLVGISIHLQHISTRTSNGAGLAGGVHYCEFRGVVDRARLWLVRDLDLNLIFIFFDKIHCITCQWSCCLEHVVDSPRTPNESAVIMKSSEIVSILNVVIIKEFNSVNHKYVSIHVKWRLKLGTR